MNSCTLLPVHATMAYLLSVERHLDGPRCLRRRLALSRVERCILVVIRRLLLECGVTYMVRECVAIPYHTRVRCSVLKYSRCCQDALYAVYSGD